MSKYHREVRIAPGKQISVSGFGGEKILTTFGNMISMYLDISFCSFREMDFSSMIPSSGCLIELSRAVIMFMSECPCSRHPEVRVISLLGLAALSTDAETTTNLYQGRIF